MSKGIPTAFINPYGRIWIDLKDGNRRLVFIDYEPTNEEYWDVAFYLYQEGFIDAVEKGELIEFGKPI